MFVAIMDSDSYEWVGLGDSEKEALESIRKRYNEEQQKMESRGYKTAETFDSVSDMTDWYGFRVYEIERGECDFS